LGLGGLEVMSEAIGLVLGLFEFLCGFAVDDLLDGEVVAAFAELIAAVDAFILHIDVGNVPAESLFVLLQGHADLVAAESEP